MARRRWLRRLVFWPLAAIMVGAATAWWLSGLYLSPGTAAGSRPAFLRSGTSDGGNAAWITPGLANGKSSKTAFVFVHGYGGSLDQWTPVMSDLLDHGYDSIEVALPGHDHHPDPQVGFGPKEARLVVDAVSTARRRGAKKVVTVGVSMGGAAVWLATELDPSIDAVATEGAYASFPEVLNDWERRAPLLLTPVIWLAERRSGIDPQRIQPLRAAQKWTKPALVLQAGDDRLIPASHAEQLARASGAELVIVPNAQHANCEAILGTDYANRLIQLANRA